MKRIILALAAFWLLLPSGGASATDDTNTVGLHNTTATMTDDCPVEYGWHFVATPNDGTSIDAITLLLDGDTVVITSWIATPKASHAYVATPPGYTEDDLQDGKFVVSGTDADVRLSNVCCYPDDTTTTSTTPPTTAPPTTAPPTTVPPTTVPPTTLPPTTTTKPPVQDSTTTSSSTTTTGPTTTVGTTTTQPTTKIVDAGSGPATGGIALAAGFAVLSGLGALLFARRAH